MASPAHEEVPSWPTTSPPPSALTKPRLGSGRSRGWAAASPVPRRCSPAPSHTPAGPCAGAAPAAPSPACAAAARPGQPRGLPALAHPAEASRRQSLACSCVYVVVRMWGGLEGELSQTAGHSRRYAWALLPSHTAAAGASGKLAATRRGWKSCVPATALVDPLICCRPAPQPQLTARQAPREGRHTRPAWPPPRGPGRPPARPARSRPPRRCARR